MKSFLTIFTLAAALVVVPIDTIFTSQFSDRNSTIAQAQQQQALDLSLTGHKREVRTNRAGLPEVTWISLEGGVLQPAPRLVPGDVVRYTISGNNRTEQPISGLVLNDDIPSNMTIVIGSGRVESGQGTITYSADAGKTYSPSPMIRETRPDGTLVSRPATAEEYTHVRWAFTSAVAAKSSVQGSYQVRLR